jgi:hypothetical protein
VSLDILFVGESYLPVTVHSKVTVRPDETNGLDPKDRNDPVVFPPPATTAGPARAFTFIFGIGLVFSVACAPCNTKFQHSILNIFIKIV